MHVQATSEASRAERPIPWNLDHRLFCTAARDPPEVARATRGFPNTDDIDMPCLLHHCLRACHFFLTDISRIGATTADESRSTNPKRWQKKTFSPHTILSRECVITHPYRNVSDTSHYVCIVCMMYALCGVCVNKSLTCGGVSCFPDAKESRGGLPFRDRRVFPYIVTKEGLIDKKREKRRQNYFDVAFFLLSQSR